MPKTISVVVNTFNEAENIERLLKSVEWADEIMICDMNSTDETVNIAKRYKAKVFSHKKEDFVELARNFAISKASGEWIFILDPDEEVQPSLQNRLIQITEKMDQIDYVRIPRKNVIFGKWMQASMWWPDYNIRFFRKGKVKWGDKIHQQPQTSGAGLDLEAEERWAIIHHHYQTITQFLERMIRYTKIQADELQKEGYKFNWTDLVKKPLGEFLSRFFANKGYQDGIHGLSLSLLQAFSHLVLYLRLWERGGFKETDISLQDSSLVSKQAAGEINYWFKYSRLSKNPFKRFVQKVKNRM